MTSAAQPHARSIVSRRSVRAGIIVLLTLVTYAPAMRGGFVWDDEQYVSKNRLLSADDGLWRIWTSPGESPQYYPLVFTSFWLETRAWGDSAFGFHVVNVLLHAVGALLLWRVLLRLQVPGAWLAGAVFALHPVHVESVAWITERKNVLSGVFYLLALAAYLGYADRRQWRPYVLSLALFACALLSKTVTCSLPVAILLCQWWKHGRVGKRDVLPLLPFFVIGICLGLATVYVEKHHVGATGAGWQLPAMERCLIAGRAVWFYIGKLIWPANLAFTYPRWNVDSAVPWHYAFPAVFLVVVALLWTLRRRIGRGPLAAVAFFVITLAPTLGFFDVYFFRFSYVADHFQYHASMGIIALLAGLGCHYARTSGRVAHGLADGFAAALVGVLSILTWNHARIYENEETLYLDTLAKNPSAWLAHNNLGRMYHEQGRYADAQHHLRMALERYPDYALAHFNLGNALAAVGELDDAVRHYERSVQLEPEAADAHNNLGVALVNQGRIEEARRCFVEAVNLLPEWAEARHNLGQVWFWLGNPGEAVAQFEAALRIDPDSAEVHYGLGNALAGQGRFDRAAAHFTEAVRLAPGWADAHNNLGRALASLGKLERAVAQYRTAIRIAPRFALAYRNLGQALADLGRLDQAVGAYEEALSTDPGDADTHCRLGDLLTRLKRVDEAIWEYRRALEIDPNHARAREGLSQVSPGSVAPDVP